jgi:hypothetical protein
MPRTRHLVVALAAILVMVLPASAAAKAGGKPIDRRAAQACAKERKQIGRSAFLKKYGNRQPARACVRRTRNRVRAALHAAESECLAELAEIGPTEFAEDYGSDETGSDALEQCINETLGLYLDPDDGDEEEDEEAEE